MKTNRMQYKEFKLQEKSNRVKAGKGSGSRHKRFRTAFTDGQLSELQAEFAISSSLTSNRRNRLSKELCLEECTVKVWFQNQRQKNRRKGTKPTAGSLPIDRYCAPESPQPTDDDYIQSEVDEEDSYERKNVLKKLTLEQPQLDRDIDIQCQTPDPREQTEKRLTEEPTCSQPVKSRGDCPNQAPVQTVHPYEMCSWGQDVYTQQQLCYPHNVQQPWHQHHAIHQQQIQAHNFQHQFYGYYMTEYQFNPYWHQQQHGYIPQQQIPWQYNQHQYIPQQTTRQQCDPSVDDEKLDIAQLIQNTIHYLS